MGACFTLLFNAEITPHFELTRNASKDGKTHSNSSSEVSSSSVVPRTPRRTEGEILQSSNLKNFMFSELKTATRNFRPETVLGEGGFGRVFKGWIDENTYAAANPGTGMVIAVKILNQEGLQGHREWLAEINYLGQLYHPNLVKLVGYCLNDEHRYLVYEFMPLGSLEKHLFSRYSQPLSWNLRMKVALGAAKGLAYLHSLEAKVIYDDFKSSSILIDSNYNAKLSDYGLAIDDESPYNEKFPFYTGFRGTYGYAAPEYIATGHQTSESDVYSFGVVLLEMLTGKRAMDKNRPRGEQYLFQWAMPNLTSRRRIITVMDACIKGQYSLRGALAVATLAEKCLAINPKIRPRMGDVVRDLEQLQDSKDTGFARREELRQHRGNQKLGLRKV